MLSNEEFVRQSLELDLFFMRTMKEHSLFLEAAFTPKNPNLSRQAEHFKNEFSKLLFEAISLSQGIIYPDLENSSAVTNYTLSAEMKTQYYSGISIDLNLTKLEMGFGQNTARPITQLHMEKVFALNQRVLPVISSLIEYKKMLLRDFTECKIFMQTYPLLIDHITREAVLFFNSLRMLQSLTPINEPKDMVDQEIFWNEIMGEHSQFIRGLLDPSENDLLNTANNFAAVFSNLEKESKAAKGNPDLIQKVTDESIAATVNIKDFKTQATVGLLECKIKSIILPLLGDHVLREANHYLHLLRMYK